MMTTAESVALMRVAELQVELVDGYREQNKAKAKAIHEVVQYETWALGALAAAVAVALLAR
jgi:hypothetical protein